MQIIYAILGLGGIIVNLMLLIRTLRVVFKTNHRVEINEVLIISTMIGAIIFFSFVLNYSLILN